MNFLKDAQEGAPQFQQWNFIGNSSLADVMDKMIENKGIFHRTQKHIVDKYIIDYMKNAGNHTLPMPRWRNFISRAGKSLERRKRELYFRKFFSRYINILDRWEYGFIAEALYFKSKIITSEEKYEKFWFDNSIDVQEVFRPNQSVIGLHNSWTPQWYKELSDKDVLENECLLSRTLRYLLT
ncbi:MAG: hypothetical protein MZV65_00365 [Chromatiales bacterium]|nr:hypothetical protein [Chromatiales bacterium]